MVSYCSIQLKSMLEDIEDGELDYEEDGQAEEIEDLPIYQNTSRVRKRQHQKTVRLFQMKMKENEKKEKSEMKTRFVLLCLFLFTLFSLPYSSWIFQILIRIGLPS